MDEHLGPVLSLGGTEAVPVGTGSGAGASASVIRSSKTLGVSHGLGVGVLKVEVRLLAVARATRSVERTSGLGGATGDRILVLHLVLVGERSSIAAISIVTDTSERVGASASVVAIKRLISTLE